MDKLIELGFLLKNPKYRAIAYVGVPVLVLFGVGYGAYQLLPSYTDGSKNVIAKSNDKVMKDVDKNDPRNPFNYESKDSDQTTETPSQTPSPTKSAMPKQAGTNITPTASTTPSETVTPTQTLSLTLSTFSKGQGICDAGKMSANIKLNYVVEAFDKDGKSIVKSEVQSITTGATDNNCVVANWNNIEGVSNYIISKKVGTDILQTSLTTNSYLDYGQQLHLYNWTNTTALPEDLTNEVTVTNNGYMYVLGGKVNGVISNRAYFSKINADGTLSSWNATTMLPISGFDIQIAHSDKYVYIVNPTEDQNYVSNKAYFAEFQKDGSLGAWKETVLPEAKGSTYAKASIYKGYAYLFGTNDWMHPTNKVFVSKLNADGTFGVWKNMASLSSADVKFYDVKIMEEGTVMGSVIKADGAHSSIDIVKASVDKDGNVSDWSNAGTIDTYQYGKFVKYNGTLFFMGNYGYPLNLVATFNPDGTIKWTQTTDYPLVLSDRVSKYNDFLYSIGLHSQTVDSKDIYVSRIAYY